MRTSKPIASISYNSEEFLKSKLQELLRNHRIDDYIYIKHDAEEDEKKDHIHVWISPNRLIDTMDLQDFFIEPDPKKPDKPLKCLPFTSSKLDDWILYSQHLPEYLASKGEARQFIYERKDFHYADEDSFERAYNHALKGSEWAHRNKTVNMIRDGILTPLEAVFSGIVPLNQANQMNAINAMMKHTVRNGHKNHEVDVDSDQDPEKEKEEIEKVVKIKQRSEERKKSKDKDIQEKELKKELPF